MDKFKALLSRKVAGIPVLAIVLVVSAIALYGAVKLRPTPATDTPADDTTPDVGTDAEVNTDQPVFQATPVIYQTSGQNVGVSSTPAADTDDAWKRRAIEWLLGNGYSNAVATSAITKYLNGEALSATEAQARDKAVGVYGLPPETIPETSTTPTPTPTTPVYNGPAAKQGTPPTTHTVKGTSDDTFAELRQLYYGGAGYGTGLIAAHNTSFPEGKRIPVGSKIIIPKLVNPKFYKATGATRTLYAIAAKNGVSSPAVAALNPGLNFPAKIGQSVRVG